ncbi:hypothetical protein ACS0TY_022385 [Phlomoides rotata]
MISWKMLQILSHVAGTDKYKNSVLGSIGRILPFRQRDFTFPSYRKFGSKDADLYLPDPAYDITIDRVVQVDFLSSSRFLSAELIKTLFIETPFTFMTGEDLHLSYQLQKYRNVGSFVQCMDVSHGSPGQTDISSVAAKAQTTVVKSNLNPIWNEELMLFVPQNYGQIKLEVYDYDKFSADDIMGEAEIDIQSMITSASAFGNAEMFEDMQIGKWLKSQDNALLEDSTVNIVDGKVKLLVSLKLQNVEFGEVHLELEGIPLDQ